MISPSVNSQKESVSRAQEMLAHIQVWPHWEDVGRVARKSFHLSHKKFQMALPEYQKFLTLIACGYTGFGMSSAEIDKIWHSHMLHSRLYMLFCEEFIGAYVHHTPCFTDDPDEPDDPPAVPSTPPPPEVPETPPLPEIPDTPPEDECLWSSDPQNGIDDAVTTSSAEQFARIYQQAFGEPPPCIWRCTQIALAVKVGN